MKSAMAIVGVSAILILALFGPFALVHDASHTGQCPLLMVNGESCLQLSQFFGHLQTIAGLLEGTVPSIMTFAPLAAAFLLLGLLLAEQARPGLDPMAFARIRHERLERAVTSLQSLLYWERRLLHSPPSV